MMINRSTGVHSFISGWTRAVFGVALVAFTLWVAALPAQGQTYSVLHTFQGTPDGAEAFQSNLLEVGGAFYGTTLYGGAYGNGTLFRLSTTGKYSILYNFTGGADGAVPDAGLTADKNGNLYGTTTFGGDNSCSLNNATGCGVVFKLDSTGHYSVLYTFRDGEDGAWPQGVVLDAAGNIYGPSYYGGDLSCGVTGGCGVVYKIDTTGHQSTLFKFEFGPTGWSPNGFLTIDATGTLYGATVNGGNIADCGGLGCGVIYKLDSSGNETILYTFRGRADGSVPSGGLLLDAKGNLYGTAYGGGDLTCSNIANTVGCGVVFAITPTGKERVLHKFTGADGAGPSLGLVRDAKGNLYSTTVYGGTANLGTVFSVAPNGAERVLHSFTGGADGGVMFSGVILDSQGNLYGNTQVGGNLSCNSPNGCGTVFKIKP